MLATTTGSFEKDRSLLRRVVIDMSERRLSKENIDWKNVDTVIDYFNKVIFDLGDQLACRMADEIHEGRL